MAVKKSKKDSHFFIYVIFKDNVFTAVKEKGTICSWKVYQRGTFSLKNGIKRKGFYLRAGPAPSVILCLVTPWDLYL